MTPSDRLIIRQSVDTDYQSVFNFLCDVIPESYSYIDKGELFRRDLLENDDSYKNYVKDIYHNKAGCHCYLMIESGTVRGMIASKPMSKYKNEIHSLYIQKDLRGLGLGGKLLATIEEVLDSNTVVNIDVITTNHAAIAFYNAKGFTEVAGQRFKFRWDEWPKEAHVMMQTYEKRYE